MGKHQEKAINTILNFMKKLLLVSVFLLGFQSAISQVNNQEKFPVFLDCQSVFNKDLEQCFYNQLQDFVYKNYQIPEVVKKKDFKGKVITLFEVDTTGTFKVLYVDAMYPELIEESKRVFASLPKIEPATYNGKATYARYTLTTMIPLQSRCNYSRTE